MYWEGPGEVNTESTISLALSRARELKIRNLVVASKRGYTAEKIREKSEEINIVCVTYHAGFREPGKCEMTAEKKEKLRDKGISILTTTHLMAGLDRALRNKFGGVYPAEIIAGTLRMLGQGLKVCVEISGMALDAGLIPYGEDIVTVAGSGSGADTAAVIRPAHSNCFFDTKVKEIICKPREF